VAHVSTEPSRGNSAFDFFTVPTLTFGVPHCFFVIEHHRRRILHFNVTAHPTSDCYLAVGASRPTTGPSFSIP
jgi:hypothetical protein